MTRYASAALVLVSPLLLSGCLVASAVGTTVSVAGDVAEGAVNTTGAVVGAAIPDGDKKKKKKDQDD